MELLSNQQEKLSSGAERYVTGSASPSFLVIN